jgi:hypothetical protein
MSKHKSEAKGKKKGSQLVIRVDKAERHAFVMLCNHLDTSAAREIRRFMRELVAAHSSEDTRPDGKMETAVIADAHEKVPANEGATLQDPDAVAKALPTEATKAGIPAGETAKPKSRQKRVQM